MNTLSFGMVQGRLIKSPPGKLQWFPQSDWEKEFALAKSIGIQFIELIAERDHNDKNPIWNDSGISRIKELCKTNGLPLHAYCNDYVVDHPLLNEKATLEQNTLFTEQGKKLGVQKYILPLFEKSEINNDNLREFSPVLKQMADHAAKCGILLCLETLLDGKTLKKYLDDLKHPNIAVVFDTGNRAALGQNVYEDIKILGSYVKHVHIKDKNAKNENVLLGSGDVNFTDVFRALKEINYNGPYTFETTRGRDPIRTAKFHMQLVEFYHGEYFVS